MINAIIQTQSGTLLVDLPRSSYDLMEKHQFSILLDHEEDEDFEMKMM